MDMKEKISDIVAKIKADKNFASKFTNNPIEAVESIIGIDLPEDQLEPLIEGVKAKLSLDQAGGLLGKVKKLF